MQKSQNAEILLSTDCQEIAKTAIKFGLETPYLRPKHLSQDRSSSYSAVKHLINWRLKHNVKPIKYIVLIQPTSPYRTVKSIQNACITLNYTDNCNAVVGVKTLKYSICDLRYISKNQYLKNINNTTNKQLYSLNGAFYGIELKSFFKYKTFVPPKTLPFVMNDLESLDIDNQFDWKLAEGFVRKLKK